MSIGENIKEIREKKGLLQKELAAELGLDKSSYSKLEKGLREVKVSELQKLSKRFDMTIDQIVNYEGDIPSEVSLEDKSAAEQNRLFNELDEDDRQTVLKIVDKMLTTKKFNQFFQENIAK
ncbi:helix-turn-helix domain-containing protein [Salibacter halophilus]|uniref:Helix-turn-helix transcriptional regulator n=1 Tax=Salibacter halophilus TaxID=1803916 RepID=A0A6N6M9R4_9FLAO|nr:helix-turn-helix transcriptional regulator [Salibacter halophilus]KAB1065891.1 helix-turn-helix transcriptional regulator [Salibacter halophilus]